MRSDTLKRLQRLREGPRIVFQISAQALMGTILDCAKRNSAARALWVPFSLRTNCPRLPRFASSNTAMEKINEDITSYGGGLAGLTYRRLQHDRSGTSGPRGPCGPQKRQSLAFLVSHGVI
jgi:hypothetical protein